jgi:tyrosyl-tRNA synthetase
MPLLEGTDGVKKMSQSLGNYIAVTEPAEEMFGKLMRVPDRLLDKFLRLAAGATDERIAEIKQLPPQDAKRVLASDVVTLYHGAGAARAARERFDKVFVEHVTPEDVAEHTLDADGDVYIPQLLQDVGFTKSNSDGRRLIDQGGVHLGDDVVRNENVPAGRLRGQVLKVGKRKFVKLV